MTDTLRTGVVGAGVMGRDIAGLLANAGFPVTLVDVDESALDAARTDLESRIPDALEAAGLRERDDLASAVTTATDTAALDGTDFVVEAVPERLDLKHRVVADVEAAIDGGAVVGTNTSSLTPGDVAAEATHPERVVLFHFANPAIPRDIVEISGDDATEAAIERAREVGEAIGKHPVLLQRERRGNGLSRLSAAIKCAATWELTRADPAEIDSAAKAIGFDRGPVEFVDLIGIDVHLHTVDNLADEYGEHFAPPPEIRQRMEAMVEDGHLGKKTGRGFLEWEGGEAVLPDVDSDYDVTPIVGALVNEAHLMVADGIADRETVNDILKRGSGGPVGPFDVESMLGADHLRSVLEARYEATGADVFRPADSLEA
jgi:enoyl-CoA hydratase/3-hydroxyacyl-CoA dehydrogenase